MKKVTLTIENSAENRKIGLEDELSVGRTNLAQEVLADSGLSRLNTTFFRDGDEVLVVDENSLNGTFVNGEKISGKPKMLADGDEIKIGSETYIRVEIKKDFYAETQNNKFTNSANYFQTGNNQIGENAGTAQKPEFGIPNPESGKPPVVLIAAGLLAFGIVFLGLIGYLLASRYEGDPVIKNGKPTPQINQSAVIPVRVIDTLGVEDEDNLDNLDDLIASWEVQDADFDAKDLEAVAVSTDAPQLAVPVADWEKQRSRAMERRNAPTGAVSGVMIPPELQGNIGKQLTHIAKMGLTREKLPRDFVALAQKRMNNDLVELPLATETYYLDNIGTSANSSPFNVFDIHNNNKTLLAPDSEEFSILQRLAANYNGQKYDLTNPNDRIQMKRRLLRMFHPKAKPVLEEIAGAYHKKFNRPLKITSLTRSLEYQFDLARATSNAYRGATPPHSTGMTFDIAYMQMTAEEQNFLMAKFAELERAGRIDSFHERGQTPCIHTFVYP